MLTDAFCSVDNTLVCLCLLRDTKGVVFKPHAKQDKADKAAALTGSLA